MFVQTINGYANLAFVKTIRKSDKGNAILDMEDGVYTTQQTYESFIEGLDVVIPDHTGSQGLSMDFDGDEFHHWLQPVIGWRITSMGALPVLPGGDGCQYLVYANGRVDQLFAGAFDSIEEAIADYKRLAGKA